MSDYKMFIEDMLTQGYAEAIPAQDLVKNNDMVFYLSHHGIYHPRKPKKVKSCI